MVTFDKRDLPWPSEERPRLIDQLCDRYETDWRASRKPRIEDYLTEVEGETRVALWLQLVMLDQELRKGLGETATLADYRESCPDRGVFLDLSTDELAPIGAAGPEAAEVSKAGRMTDATGTIAGRLDVDRTVDRPRAVADLEVTTAAESGQAMAVAGLPPTVGPPREGDADGPDGLATARPGASFGDYVLLEKLGAGGMGVVFKARQKGLNRLVALKMIKAGVMADDRHIRLFRSEAESVAALDHPHIVPVLDSGEHEGMLYYSMKLVEGQDLSRGPGRYRDKPAAIARLMARVAEAIAHAHQRGVLHRDIKPSNILVDAQGEPHVIDFGLAMRLDTAAVETTIGNPVGTPSYMSPEQARGRRDAITTATDVYGLGTLLYALLTGRPPFTGSSAVEILHHVMDDVPPRPRDRYARVDRDLETICLKCLSKEPKDRYPSARELADDLNRWLDGRPILARPASRVERAAKWVRRRKLVAALSGAAVIGAILGVSGLAWGWSAAVVARDEAERGEDGARHLAYASTLNLAERDWRDANIAGVLRHLAETRPPAGKSDLRDFEWYYIDRLCRAQERVLTGGDVISSVAYGPGGRLLASASWDKAITLWDPATGQVIRRLVAEARPNIVAFHPDGKTLASTGSDSAVTIWDVATGQAIRSLRGHPHNVLRLAYSPDGKTLATAGGAEDRIRLWDPAAATLLHTIDVPSAEIVFGDDKTLLAAARDGAKIQAWDVATGALIRTVVDDPAAGPIEALAIAPGGKVLASGTADGGIQVREVDTGRLVQSLRDHRSPIVITRLEFSPDGRRLASGSLLLPAVTIWEVATGRLLRTLQGHTASTLDIAFSPDGVQLACASNDATVRIWDTTRDQDSRSLAAKGKAYAVAFGPDGSFLAAANADGTIALHDVASGQVARTLEGHAGPVVTVAIRRDGRLAASGGSSDRTVRIWDVATGRGIHTLRGHADALSEVDFSPDGKTLASASRDRTVKLWDVDTGKLILTIDGHIGPVNSIAFTPDGRTLVSASDDFILSWDVKTGRRTGVIQAGCHGIPSIAIRPDGKWVASGGFDRTVKIWDLATGRLVHTLLGHSSAVDALAFSPDGRRLVSASRDRSVRVWDPACGQGVLVLRGHSGMVFDVAVSPDGKRIASSGEDQKVKLWEAGAVAGPGAAR